MKWKWPGMSCEPCYQYQYKIYFGSPGPALTTRSEDVNLLQRRSLTLTTGHIMMERRVCHNFWWPYYNPNHNNEKIWNFYNQIVSSYRVWILSMGWEQRAGRARKRATSLKFSCYWQCLEVGHFKVFYNLQQHKTICISKLLNKKSRVHFTVFNF